MPKFTNFVIDTNEAALVDQLHDRVMQMKGPDAIVARGMKDLMPALMRFVEDEIKRGTPTSHLVLASGHLALSIHMSALLTIAGGAQHLAPILPTVLEHIEARYAAAAAHIQKQAAAETEPA